MLPPEIPPDDPDLARGGRPRSSARSSAAGYSTAFRALRLTVFECGFGWLPFWARPLDEQAFYIGGTAPL
jgi:hypothetical protein